MKFTVARVTSQQQTSTSEPWSNQKVEATSLRYQQIKQPHGDWVSENDIGKYLRGGWYGARSFIRQKPGFLKCIKDGHYYMYYKPDQCFDQTNKLQFHKNCMTIT